MSTVVLRINKIHVCGKYDMSLQLQPLWMTKLLEGTSVGKTLSPGRFQSTSATTIVVAPSSMTSGSFLLLTAGKSLCSISLLKDFSEEDNCNFIFVCISAPTPWLLSWEIITSGWTKAQSSTCQWTPSTGTRVTTTQLWTMTSC